MGAVNNAVSVSDSYREKHGYRLQNAAKGENKEQVVLPEEHGVILSINTNERSMFDGTQAETENSISQMWKISFQTVSI